MLLETKNITLCWSDNQPLFTPLSLTLPARSCLLIEGKSGSGKTSLLRALCHLNPFQGQIFLHGRPSQQYPITQWRQKMLYLPSRQQPRPDAMLIDYLLLPFSLKIMKKKQQPSQKQINEQLAQIGLNHLRPHTPMHQLSMGELARLAIVRAIILSPDVLLLDEPTANLDSQSEALYHQCLHSYLAQGGAIIAASHQDSFIQAMQPAIYARHQTTKIDH